MIMISFTHSVIELWLGLCKRRVVGRWTIIECSVSMLLRQTPRFKIRKIRLQKRRRRRKCWQRKREQRKVGWWRWLILWRSQRYSRRKEERRRSGRTHSMIMFLLMSLILRLCLSIHRTCLGKLTRACFHKIIQLEMPKSAKNRLYIFLRREVPRKSYQSLSRNPRPKRSSKLNHGASSTKKPTTSQLTSFLSHTTSETSTATT